MNINETLQQTLPSIGTSECLVWKIIPYSSDLPNSLQIVEIVLLSTDLVLSSEGWTIISNNKKNTKFPFPSWLLMSFVFDQASDSDGTLSIVY